MKVEFVLSILKDCSKYADISFTNEGCFITDKSKTTVIQIKNQDHIENSELPNIINNKYDMWVGLIK